MYVPGIFWFAVEQQGYSLYIIQPEQRQPFIRKKAGCFLTDESAGK
jgi:hypothetical protein